MKIFLKYVLKSMLEKKARFFLLLIAIVLSTGLFVGSMGAVDAAIDSFVKPQLEQLENKDVYVSAKDGAMAFDLEGLKLDGLKDIVPEIRGSFIYDTDDMQTIQVIGREEKYINKDVFIDGNELKDFNGEKCIISKRVSEEFDLKVGDKLNTLLNGEKVSLVISKISANQGVFYGDTKENFQMIVPYKYLAEKFDMKDKYNVAFANKTEANIKDSIEKFNDANTNFIAKELYNEDAVKSQVAQINNMLYMMLLVVVFMSSIIIYSSFKLTVTERMPIIGTFLSQGATRGTIRRILYLESLCYGVLGGVIGNGLGIGILYLINYVISPLKEYGILQQPNINIRYLIYGLVFSILLSVASAIVPIIKTNKLQVKDVILNTSDSSEQIGIGKFVAGIVLLLGVIIVNSLKTKWLINISPVLFILAIIAVILIYPKVVEFISKNIFSKLRDTNPINALALNNMSTSKVLLGNINLMNIAIISIIMINSLSISIKDVVVEAYEKLNYSIEINVPESGAFDLKEKVLDILKEEPNVVQSSIQRQQYAGGEIEGNNYSVMGIEPDKYLDFDNYLNWDKEEYKEFENGSLNDVVITEKIAEKVKLKKGDSFDMKVGTTNKSYNVVGIIDGKLYNNGAVVFINYKGLPKEYVDSASIQFYLNTTGRSADVKENINKKIRALGGSVLTFEETKARNVENNKQLTDILSIFSFMSVVIGAFGVLNNIGISFIQRKKDLAVLSSVGMSKFQRNKMLIIESILTVVWSIIIVTPFSYLGMSIMSKISKLLGFDMEVVFNIKFVPVIFLVSLAIVLIATIPVLLKSKKLSIIEELKYE